MFWDKKKKNHGLPDLPQNSNLAPSIKDYQRHPVSAHLTPPPQHPQIDEEPVHELPTFPDAPNQKGFSQSAIKEAVSSQEGFQTKEMEEWHPSQSQPMQPSQPMEPMQQQNFSTPNPMPMVHEEHHNHDHNDEEYSFPSPPPIHPTPQSGIIRPPTPSDELSPKKPIFVKVDNFRAARESLEVVKEKLTEIDELLHMIRDVKQKEDQELSTWEKEMENVKSRISHVSKEIFDSAYSP